MKTKELIEAVFEPDGLKGAKRRNALEKLIKKLDKRKAKLKRKLDDEKSEKVRQQLKDKLKVNTAHRKKAKKLQAELSST